MTWLLTSPGHQQLWYWLFRINASLMKEDFEYLQYLIAKISQKRRYSFVPLKINSARHVLTNAWWRHQMEAFSALLAICAGNSPVPAEFPSQRPVTRSFDVFFDLRPNKRLSKQRWGWWFETPSIPLWRNCNESYRCLHGAEQNEIYCKSTIWQQIFQTS